MSPEQRKALIGMIFEFLEEEKYAETLHKLECESRSFLNVEYIEELVLNGNWEELERYLSAFTKVGDNSSSSKMFFEIGRHKYLEALESGDLVKAFNILNDELKVFARTRRDDFSQLSRLLIADDFRASMDTPYTSAETERTNLMESKLHPLIKLNPIFRDTQKFPTLNHSSLRYLLSRSFDWQYKVCQQNLPFSEMTLQTDRSGRNNSRGKELEGLHPMYEEGTSSLSWRLTEFVHPSQCRSLILGGSNVNDKISALVYVRSVILLLTESGMHQFWRWPVTHANPLGKVTTRDYPIAWQPGSSPMINDLMYRNLGKTTSCFALSNDGTSIVSSSGGTISLYSIISHQKVCDLINPPPMATALAFHPADNSIIAVGMDNSTIWIYSVHLKQVLVKMAAHFARVTGLAFSRGLNFLVSTGADSQIIAWECGLWIKKRQVFMQFPAQVRWTLHCTKIHFHVDDRQFLVYDETQLSLYDATSLARIKQLITVVPVSLAVYSGDCQLIYACFRNGVITIFCSDNFQRLCHIDPSVYIPRALSRQNVQPTALAANPENTSQVAVGLSNGRVVVLEHMGWDLLSPVDASMSRGQASSNSAPPGPRLW